MIESAKGSQERPTIGSHDRSSKGDLGDCVREMPCAASETSKQCYLHANEEDLRGNESKFKTC